MYRGISSDMSELNMHSMYSLFTRQQQNQSEYHYGTTTNKIEEFAVFITE
jgi:hypothetical protein